jgi:hypothetical protein
MAEAAIEPIGWERAFMAAEKVKERLSRATRALDAAGVPYAVAGDNAVAEWVARVDQDAVRNTRDVDFLIRRPDFPAARACLEAVGLIYHELLDIDTFIDGPQGKRRGGIHLLYTGEKIRRDDDFTLPEIEESERAVEFQVVNLEALLLMKLTSYRLNDKVHVLNMIGVGLLDATWPARFPAPLGDRLQQLLDDPNG